MKFKLALLGLTLTAALTVTALGMLKGIEYELKRNLTGRGA